MDPQKRLHVSEYNDKIFNPDLWKRYQHLIFVYTPPKVGSTSLVSSLRLSASYKFIILHIHNESMLNILTGYDNPHKITVMDIIHYNAEMGKKVYVIDIYRTPIERKMSLYFENIAHFHFNNEEEKVCEYDLKRIIHRFNCLFKHIGNEQYFEEKYGLQTLTSSFSLFDKEKKYILDDTTYNNVTFIKLRLQDFSEWASILSHLLGVDIVTVEDYNGENKRIGDLYRRFKNEYCIPTNFLEEIKEKDVAFQMYHSEEEREEYINKNKIKTNEPFLSSFTEEEYLFYMMVSKENQYYSIIQRDHYLDIGCVCYHCNLKRREIKQKIRNGENVSIRVIHEEVVNEKKTNIQNKFISSLQEKINQIKQVKQVRQVRHAKQNKRKFGFVK